MATHFSGESARSFPQNPMQSPTALTVSQSDSETFPRRSVLCVHDWQESLGGFSSLISVISIFLQLFHSSYVLVLSPFSFLFPAHGLQHAISPFLHAFALAQSLHFSLLFLLHLCFHSLPFFLQQTVATRFAQLGNQKLYLIYFFNQTNPQSYLLCIQQKQCILQHWNQTTSHLQA